MTELSPIIFRALGLPIPEKGEKLPFNYNAVTKEADGITDSNRDGVINEKDRNGWIEPEELYELVNSNPKYASVSRKISRINSENPFRITPEINQHVENLKKLHFPKGDLETAVIIFRSIIFPDASFELLQDCTRTKCYFSDNKGLEKSEGGLGIRYVKDRSKLKRWRGDLRPEQILKAKVKSATCTELCFLLVAFFRAAGIESYFKMEEAYADGVFGHAYVAAKIYGKWYKLDPTHPLFEKTDEYGMSDREGYAVYHLNKVKALYLQGKLKKAMEHCKTALEFKPDFAAAWNNMGMVFSSQGKLGEAKKCYEKALEYEPKYAFAWMNKGVLLEDDAKLDEAKKCYEEAIGIKSDYAMAWLRIGKLLEKQGRLAEARIYYKKAIELDPSLGKNVKDKEVAFLK